MANSTEENLYKLVRDQKEQFVIPIYQRGYDWKEENVNKLMDDLLEFANENLKFPDQKYFVGNVILKTIIPKSSDEIIKKSLVVDGQQRITTTLLMLLAIYKYDPKTYPKLKDIFILKEKNKEKIKIDRLNDGQTLNNIIFDNIKNDDKKTNMYKNYKFIFNRINKEKLSKSLFNAIQKSLIISVWLSGKENENKVFETINSAGKPLKESDLIKNFIFFYSHTFNKTQEKELLNQYEKSVFKIKEDEIDNFYRHFSVIYSKNKSLPSLRKQRSVLKKIKTLVDENYWTNQNFEV